MCRAVTVVAHRMHGLIVSTAQKNEVFRGAAEMHEAAIRGVRQVEQSMLEARALEQEARDAQEQSCDRHIGREASLRQATPWATRDIYFLGINHLARRLVGGFKRINDFLTS